MLTATGRRRRWRSWPAWSLIARLRARLLLLRHQRPHPDRAGGSPAKTSNPASSRNTWRNGSSTARRSRRSTSTAAPPTRSPSSTAPAWTTSRARPRRRTPNDRSACRHRQRTVNSREVNPAAPLRAQLTRGAVATTRTHLGTLRAAAWVRAVPRVSSAPRLRAVGVSRLGSLRRRGRTVVNGLICAGERNAEMGAVRERCDQKARRRSWRIRVPLRTRGGRCDPPECGLPRGAAGGGGPCRCSRGPPPQGYGRATGFGWACGCARLRRTRSAPCGAPRTRCAGRSRCPCPFARAPWGRCASRRPALRRAG